jgi:hypothetical protein
MPTNVNIQQIIFELFPANGENQITSVIDKYIEKLKKPGTTMSPTQEIYNIYPQYFDRDNHMGEYRYGSRTFTFNYGNKKKCHL